jgi:hypothetical protein
MARSEILPLVLLANVPTPPGEVSEGRQGFRYSASSCAGAQRGLNAAISLRFKSDRRPQPDVMVKAFAARAVMKTGQDQVPSRRFGAGSHETFPSTRER